MIRYLLRFCNIAITSRSFWKVIVVFDWIIHRHFDIKIFCIIYFCVIYFRHAVGKWWSVFEFRLFIISICDLWCIIFSCVNNSYYAFNKYICITIITSTYLKHCLKLDLTIGVIRSTWDIILFSTFFRAKFRWLIWCFI